MGLIEQAKNDIREITSNLDEFGVELTFKIPLNYQVTIDDSFDESFVGAEAVIVGLHTKHHLGFDIESGTDKVVKNAHCSFSEELLLETNPDYPIRDLKDRVAMVGHQVSAKDSTGVLRTYKIDQAFADETVGLIMCILGDFVDE
jgi:hypothetical protein